MHITVYKTKDQSDTLYVEELDETYHSRNGAVEESRYVFLKMGLAEVAQHLSHIRILEIGFGTGLNAMLTLDEAEKLNLQVEYDSIEAFPLPASIIEQLNYPNLFSADKQAAFMELHTAEWDKPVLFTTGFTLTKLYTRLEDFEPNRKYDLIYFDAFAPDKQPEMWHPDQFTKLYLCLNNGGILVTYSSKGEVKRSLKQIGFEVQRLPGPPFKRHMLRAIKPNE